VKGRSFEILLCVTKYLDQHGRLTDKSLGVQLPHARTALKLAEDVHGNHFIKLFDLKSIDMVSWEIWWNESPMVTVDGILAPSPMHYSSRYVYFVKDVLRHLNMHLTDDVCDPFQWEESGIYTVAPRISQKE